MAINLITGLPGNAKTLFAIRFVLDWAAREGRKVFYHGIPELTLDWELLDDPKQWATLPPNAIFVLDEAQKIFRNRTITTNPPSFVTDLETHRHLGIDIVMLTQHPRLIDPAVRTLTQTHRHLVRLWGMEATTVHKWNGVKENCDKSRADSESSKWVFDKSLYGVYKSADAHTMKRSIPGRVKFLLAVPVLLAAMAYSVYAIMIKPKTSAATPQLAQPGQTAVGTSVATAAPVFDPVVDAKMFVFNSTPRVEGVPHTAPKYDDITKPSRAPVPAICIVRSSRCQCYSQQGTKLQVDRNQCLDIAHNGYFQDFDPDGERPDQHAVASSGQQQQQHATSNSPVIVIPYVPEPKRNSGVKKG